MAPLAGIEIHAIQPGANVVWIGAEDGLWQVAPDAATALPYRTVNGQNLPAGAATAITQDANGALWLGITSAIVQLQPDDGIFQVYRPFELAHNAARISSIGIGADATVWVATNNSGVVKYTFENGEQVASTPYGSGASVGLDTDIVRNIAIDAEGAIWFATPIGASRHYPWAWVSAGDDFNGLPISDLAVDATGKLWIAPTR